MAYKEKEIKKLYYSIGEVAAMFSVEPSLIRFWESKFDTIRPKKNRKGDRQFTQEDIEAIRVVYHLVRARGFTLQGAGDMLKKNKKDVTDKLEMIDSLKKVRQLLTDLKDKL